MQVKRETVFELLVLWLPFSNDPVNDNAYQSSEEAPYRGKVFLEEDTCDKAGGGHEETQKPHLLAPEMNSGISVAAA